MTPITFRQYVEMPEGLLSPDRPTEKRLTRIKPFTTTDTHRRRRKPKPVNGPQLGQADRTHRRPRRAEQPDPEAEPPPRVTRAARQLGPCCRSNTSMT